MKKTKGLVYILTNPSMSPDCIKIGFTINLGKRLKELDTTALAEPFEPYMTVATEKYKILEGVIHHEIDKLTDARIRKKREFFKLDPAIAGDLLMNLAKLIDDAEVDDFGNRNESKKLPGGRIRPMSKPTTFKMLGIPIGSLLSTRNKLFPDIVTVDEINRVRLPNGEIKTISRVVVDITNTSRNGFQVYKYNGKSLVDIRKDLDKNYFASRY